MCSRVTELIKIHKNTNNKKNDENTVNYLDCHSSKQTKKVKCCYYNNLSVINMFGINKQ